MLLVAADVAVVVVVFVVVDGVTAALNPKNHEMTAMTTITMIKTTMMVTDHRMRTVAYSLT